MYSFFCNKCFEHNQQDATIQFYFSTCQHVLCKSCLHPVCPICSRPYKPNMICKGMPVQIATLFADPLKLFRSFQRVVMFQIEQDAYLFRYFNRTLPVLMKKLHREHNALVKVENQIRGSLTNENQRIAKLKKYLAYHERHLEQVPPMPLLRSQPLMRSSHKRSAGSIMSAATSPEALMTNKWPRVRTPTLSLPDSNDE